VDRSRVVCVLQEGEVMDARRKSGGQVPQVAGSAERSPKVVGASSLVAWRGPQPVGDRTWKQGQQDDQGAGQKVGCTYLC
jgi:hypothetical protein